MKITSSLLCCALMLSASCALAKSVTIKLTGHVTELNSAGMLNGLETGDPVTATYTYVTDAPDQDPSSSVGDYQLSTSRASVRVTAGTLDFESETGESLPGFRFLVRTSPSEGDNWVGLGISSIYNNSAIPGAYVETIAFDFWNWIGPAPASDALPAAAPDLQMFTGRREIAISGMDPDGNPFRLIASIASAELVPPGIEVSPATGSFLPQQRFDAALLLQPDSNVVNMHASAGGVALPLSYPGTCQLILLSDTSRPAIRCPDAHTALAGATSSQIQWQVELTDGTVLNETVVWRLIQ